jgi:hypothetical protein
MALFDCDLGLPKNNLEFACSVYFILLLAVLPVIK